MPALKLTEPNFSGSMAPTSPRSSSSGSLFSTSAEQKVKMRILHGGDFYQVPLCSTGFSKARLLSTTCRNETLTAQTCQDSRGAIAYRGGDSFLENVPLDWKYAQLVHRLCEKVDRAVSMKYQLPEDYPSLDRLITVSDDRDVQVGNSPQGCAAPTVQPASTVQSSSCVAQCGSALHLSSGQSVPLLLLCMMLCPDAPALSLRGEDHPRCHRPFKCS